MSKIRNIMVCIPKTGHSYDREFMESYTHAKNWLFHQADLIPFEFALVEYFCHTFPIDANRNECIARAIEHDIDLTIWLDTDQQFPRDTLFKLIRHDLPIVAGVYHAKAPPYYPIIFKLSKDSENFTLFDPVMQFPEKELFEADMIGMGCVAVKREVFEKLPQPWFKYQPHPEGTFAQDTKFRSKWGIADVSEDVWFWKQVRQHTDYKILVDPSIDVAHFGRFRVDRGIWQSYVDTQQRMYAAEHGEDDLKLKVAEQCKAEAIKERKLKQNVDNCTARAVIQEEQTKGRQLTGDEKGFYRQSFEECANEIDRSDKLNEVWNDKPKTVLKDDQRPEFGYFGGVNFDKNGKIIQ